MRYQTLSTLLLAVVVGGCSTGSSHGDGFNAIARGTIQPTVESTTPPETAASASAVGGSTIAKIATAQASINGASASTVLVGTPYAFTPTVTEASGTALTFAIVNCPSWATFNTATGELSGTPSPADIGTYSNISISVSGESVAAALAPFSIAVTEVASGTAMLSWVAPTQNTDGTPLLNLTGYQISYGTDPKALTQSVNVAAANLDSYVVRNLLPGTWYFAVQAYTASNVESVASTMVSKRVL